MISTVDASKYIEDLVMNDSGPITMELAAITNSAWLLFLHPQDEETEIGNMRCIASGTREEMEGYKARLLQRRSEYQASDKFHKIKTVKEISKTLRGDASVAEKKEKALLWPKVRSHANENLREKIDKLVRKYQ